MKKIIFILSVLFITRCSGDGYRASEIYFLLGTVSSVSLTIVNECQMSNNSTKGRAVPILGIGFGTLTLVDGVGQISGFDAGGLIFTAIGTLGIVTSVLNLSRSWEPKDKRTSWNLQNFQMYDKRKSVGVGFCLIHKF